MDCFAAAAAAVAWRVGLCAVKPATRRVVAARRGPEVGRTEARHWRLVSVGGSATSLFDETSRCASAVSSQMLQPSRARAATRATGDVHVDIARHVDGVRH